MLPTYSYARIYANGDELKKHRDRPACEVSVTLHLGSVMDLSGLYGLLNLTVKQYLMI
jgi:hypothetical protein